MADANGGEGPGGAIFNADFGVADRGAGGDGEEICEDEGKELHHFCWKGRRGEGPAVVKSKVSRYDGNWNSRGLSCLAV